jgi:MerR family transcriptional regulator, copper efflux regulator
MLKQLEEQGKSMAKPAHGMTIGVAARKSGCAVSQIRYYEEIGLLRPADRTANGRRVYGWPDISRLQLLRRLRSFGLGLRQIRVLVKVIDVPDPRCDQTRTVISAHIQALQARKQELEALERSLKSINESCGELCAAGLAPACPIVGSESARHQV